MGMLFHLIHWLISSALSLGKWISERRVKKKHKWALEEKKFSVRGKVIEQSKHTLTHRVTKYNNKLQIELRLQEVRVLQKQTQNTKKRKERKGLAPAKSQDLFRWKKEQIFHSLLFFSHPRELSYSFSTAYKIRLKNWLSPVTWITFHFYICFFWGDLSLSASGEPNMKCENIHTTQSVTGNR